MKRILAATLGVGLLAVSAGAEEGGIEDPEDRINYTLGYQIGSSLKRQEVDLRSEILLKGIEDAFAGSEPRLSEEERRATVTLFNERVAAVQRERQQALAEENLAKARQFLAANAKEEGIQTRPSGLQYLVLQAGTGSTPSPTSTVTVHYRGTLIDGTEFDSSYQRNEPARFRADRLVPGWSEALQLMKEGAKWKLFLPPDLAYGTKGTGPIPPNSALIFEMELLAVE
jgi:FKBP-type peptidyl-prolyl cis-trans isomerase FklB